MARFVAGSLVAIAVIIVGGFFALRSVAIDEATRGTLDRVSDEGRLIEATGLTDGILRHQPGAVEQLDRVVARNVLSDSVVRVKLWRQDGTILYSDVPELIGRSYPLGAEEAELFETGGSDAEISDLDEPENVFERGEGKLLEAHTTVHAPDGTPLLFEIYQRFSSLNASGLRLLGTLMPPLVGGIVVLLLVEVPLAWTMARRLERGYHEREQLLSNAIEASTWERQRIAAALHDGVVQDLAGVAFGLAPMTEAARRRGDVAEAEVLRKVTGTLRQGVRDLRTLLVEIHPPNLQTTGLAVALSDLLSPLQADGIVATLEIDDAAAPPDRSEDTLVYRVAREAIRNARRHARASTVAVRLRSSSDWTRLVVTDDGVGFAPDQRNRRGAEGHLGLTLLAGIVEQVGGTLDVSSAPGEGTTVTLEFPHS